MLRIGVLRLVDEDVIEAAVELVENPGRDPRPLQQVTCPQDEIVVIEHRPPTFDGGVGLDERVAQAHQRRRHGERESGVAPLAHEAEARRLGRQHFAGVGSDGEDRFMDEGLAHLGAALGEISAEILLEGDSAARGMGQPLGDRAPVLGVSLAAALHGLGRAPEGGAVECRIGAGGGEDRFFVVRLVQSQAIAERGDQAVERSVLRDEGREPGPFARHLRRHVDEVTLGKMGRDLRDRPAQAVLGAGLQEHALARRIEKLGRRALVGDGEMRRQAGLQRKAAKNRFAERVDGLDPEPAGRVQDHREQTPRPLALRRRGRRAA